MTFRQKLTVRGPRIGLYTYVQCPIYTHNYAHLAMEMAMAMAMAVEVAVAAAMKMASMPLMASMATMPTLQ